MKGVVITRSLYISYNAITEPIVQSQVMPYLKELTKDGMRFCLLTYEKNRMSQKEDREIRDRLKKEFENAEALQWFYLKYHKTPSVPATLFDVFVGFFYSLYIVISNRIDVIHSRAIVAALVGYPAAKLLSKKFIFDTRGIDSEEYVDAGLWKRGGLRHKVVGFLERMLIRSSDHVITLTHRFSEVLKRDYGACGTRLSVIPCAVDLDRFKMTRDKTSRLAGELGLDAKFVIAYIGSLGTWYMLDEMLDFFERARRRIDNAHLLILTQTDKVRALAAAKAHGIDIADITIDTVSYARMPDYLSFCDAGIFFIKPVFSKISSSPVKFAEYLASGLPVIINRGIGDTDGIVQDNRLGVVIDAFEETRYDKAVVDLIDLLKDPDLASRCRDAAERHLSLESAAAKYRAIYKELMESR